jgi:hypothetical protein
MNLPSVTCLSDREYANIKSLGRDTFLSMIINDYMHFLALPLCILCIIFGRYCAIMIVFFKSNRYVCVFVGVKRRRWGHTSCAHADDSILFFGVPRNAEHNLRTRKRCVSSIPPPLRERE